MTTSEQAALLAKHRADVMNSGTEYEWADCRECNVPFPCDVHRMAELKDAEIAEHVLRAESLRAELSRLNEEMDGWEDCGPDETFVDWYNRTTATKPSWYSAAITWAQWLGGEDGTELTDILRAHFDNAAWTNEVRIPRETSLVSTDAEIAELRAEIERLRERIGMDDFDKNTTPGGTWIERGDE